MSESTKKSSSAGLWLFFGVLMAIIIYVMYQNAGADDEADDQTDYAKIVDIDESDASIICNNTLKSVALYGYKSSNILGKIVYKIDDKKNGQEWSVQFPVQMQNQFGAYAHMTGYCHVKMKGSYLEKIEASPTLVTYYRIAMD